jgi:hypothetical protein
LFSSYKWSFFLLVQVLWGIYIYIYIYMPKSLSTIQLITKLGFAYHVKHSKKFPIKFLQSTLYPWISLQLLFNNARELMHIYKCKIFLGFKVVDTRTLPFLCFWSMFMIINTLSFMRGKSHKWKTFWNCKERLVYHLVLAFYLGNASIQGICRYQKVITLEFLNKYFMLPIHFPQPWQRRNEIKGFGKKNARYSWGSLWGDIKYLWRILNSMHLIINVTLTCIMW